MPAGRPRKPTALKLLKGTFRKGRENPKEPIISKDIDRPEPPAHFSERAVRQWWNTIENLPKGVVKELDLSTLIAYHEAEDYAHDAYTNLQAFGSMTISPNGFLVTSPYSTEYHKYSLLRLKLAQELGFTPSSRSKIVADVDPGDKEDPWKDMAGAA